MTPSVPPAASAAPHHGVRLANAGDLDIIDSLSAALHAHESIACGPADRRRALQSLLGNPALGFVMLLERPPTTAGATQTSRDGRLVAGYAAVATCHSVEFGGTAAILDELWVEPHVRGHGHGTRLIEACAAHARSRGLVALRLEVAQDNPQALRLYQRMGFKGHQRDLLTLPLAR